MTCQDCGSKMSIEKTAHFSKATMRVEQCACGSRFETEEKVIRRLPATVRRPLAPAGSTPAGDQSPPATAYNPPATVGGDGGGLPSGLSGSDSGSPSGPSQPPDLQGDRPPAREASTWPPHRWLSLFSRAWCAKYGRLAYGNASDAKACGNLADLIERMPETEILAAQADAGDMIAAFLASEAQAVTKARHPFGFFVTEFGGLRVPEQPGRPRRNGKTAGNVGVLKDWLNREEAKENSR